MARHVRLFQRRFVDAILRGEKWHTIRPNPKRKILRGDTASLRYWTGQPYRSKQKKIMEVDVIRVEGVRIQLRPMLVGGYLTDHLEIFVGGKRLTTLEQIHLAFSDGFDNRADLVNWFRREHGLPFEGILIKWRPRKE